MWDQWFRETNHKQKPLRIIQNVSKLKNVDMAVYDNLITIVFAVSSSCEDELDIILEE